MKGVFFAILIAGACAALWRYIRNESDSETDAARARRLRAEGWRSQHVQEMDAARMVPKRTVIDGPPTRALSRTWDVQ